MPTCYWITGKLSLSLNCKMFAMGLLYPLLKSISMTDLSISDHYVVNCKFYLSSSSTQNKTRQVMPMKHISAEIFAHQLEEHYCLPSQKGSALRFWLQSIIAPFQTITIKVDSLKPWYNDSIHTARQRKR